MQPLNAKLSLKSINAIKSVFELPPSAALSELAEAASEGIDELTKMATQRLKVIIL